jgi:hypothetical protein
LRRTISKRRLPRLSVLAAVARQASQLRASQLEHFHCVFDFVVPVERIELPTFGLQNRCSTAELNRLRY